MVKAHGQRELTINARSKLFMVDLMANEAISGKVQLLVIGGSFNSIREVQIHPCMKFKQDD